jgi:hypothetical protein
MPEQTIEGSDAACLKQKCSYISHSFVYSLLLYFVAVSHCKKKKKKKRDNKILTQEMSTLRTAQ